MMLKIPPNTKFEERNVVVDGDVVIGANSDIDYGIIGKRIVIGERTKINGDVIGDEITLESWVSVKGNVISRGYASIGEFSSIDGRLSVYGDLEIGRNVRIKEGFEAKGLITIQDPLPIIIFLFVYIMELLRLGKLNELEELFEEKYENPMIVPDNTVINIGQIKTNSNAIFERSRVTGNVKARSMMIRDCELFGSIRGEDIVVENSRVHGAIEGRRIYIIDNSEIYGFIKAEEIFMENGCSVEGSMVGKMGVWIKDEIEPPEVIEVDVGQGEIQEDVSESIP